MIGWRVLWCSPLDMNFVWLSTLRNRFGGLYWVCSSNFGGERKQMNSVTSVLFLYWWRWAGGFPPSCDTLLKEVSKQRCSKSVLCFSRLGCLCTNHRLSSFQWNIRILVVLVCYELLWKHGRNKNLGCFASCFHLAVFNIISVRGCTATHPPLHLCSWCELCGIYWGPSLWTDMVLVLQSTVWKVNL